MMQQLLAEHWNEAELRTELDRIEALLEPHLARTQRRFIDAIDAVHDFIEERRGDIVAELEAGLPLWDRKPRPPFTVGGR